jgi:hypothetical protein
MTVLVKEEAGKINILRLYYLSINIIVKLCINQYRSNWKLFYNES